MKKIVKVVALLSIAAAVMMGCKNPAGGNTDDPTGGNTTGGNNTPSSEAPAPTDPTTPTTPVTPAKWDGKVDLSTAKHNLVSWAQNWGEATNKSEYKDGKLIVTSGNGWANSVDIPLEKDLSGFTKVSVKASVSADWCAKNDDGTTKDASAIKLEIYSSDTTASELSKEYGDKTFLALTATPAVTSINLSDAGQLYGDTITDKADLKAVKSLKINLQDGTGVLTIESIIFE